MTANDRVEALKASCPILRLSQDIMQNILRYLTTGDIFAVCRCSSHFYDAGRRVLYEAPKTTGYERTQEFMIQLDKQPHLARWVATLELNPTGGDSCSPFFLLLCSKVIKMMDNIVELNLTGAPYLPAVMGPHTFPKLTRCGVTEIESAIPFLEANADNILELHLIDQGGLPDINRKINFTRLFRAVIPLSLAPYVLPGTSPVRVELTVTSDHNKRALELRNFQQLAGVPILSLKVTSERLKSDIIAPIARYASRELQELEIETARPHTTAQRRRFFDALEIHVALMRNLHAVKVPGTSGTARLPTIADLDEMENVCNRLSKRCPTLQCVYPGFDLYWRPYGVAWFPITPEADYERYSHLIGLWGLRKVANNPSIWGPMRQTALREHGTGITDFEEANGITDVNEIPRVLGGWSEDLEADEGGAGRV
ncbi:uncharacterized protein SCHCODRAFT_02533896 [Schizophyllum commune H4-8]|uniref:uncharacterized protein n=1 Tax=Schizophyllum commune (strain H4-8 / FGSC 9210) TaxID=578458 RepID=UPI00215F2ED1|nr:uncharacterized protein SCHCODRAFT_02533896 [Schizophyllum commune H4-8]KAI5897059.1 hypothetical protein SCHCODRAFT_02533896 [Schizophyllum commune H4-8]